MNSEFPFAPIGRNSDLSNLAFDRFIFFLSSFLFFSILFFS